MILRTLAAALAALGVFGAAQAADLELGHPFADNMVLQRDMPVRVWGWTAAGADVKVSFAGQSVVGKAGTNGEWRVELRPMPASSEGRTLIVTSQTLQTSVSNVVVGEVWLAAGQSNMELGITGKVIRYRDFQGRLVSQWTRRPDIRIVRNKTQDSVKPLRRQSKRAEWHALRPGNADCSAVAWYYALELNATLDVPVGIITAAWGGSRIQPFIPAEGFAAAGLDVAQEKTPSCHWNWMLNPWTPMAMRGFIWYQGESNMDEIPRYGRLMDALYKGWSAAFENPKLHFNFVQLAPWGHRDIAAMQEVQDKYAKSEPNATMAVVNDIGNVGDIHPSDKETVAKRLAALALKHDYGYDNKADSPGFRSACASRASVVRSPSACG